MKPAYHSKGKISPLQNTVPLVALRQPELKHRPFISHIRNGQSPFPLHFVSLLAVPVFTETLRKYPIVPFLDRISCSDYELPAHTGTGTITLPAGTGVFIPVLALHHDPTYFPQPEKFDPDRFTGENNRRRPNYTYIPFGEGPRMCIGKDRHKSFFPNTRRQKTG
jgi:cytochrome P450